MHTFSQVSGKLSNLDLASRKEAQGSHKMDTEFYIHRQLSEALLDQIPHIFPRINRKLEHINTSLHKFSRNHKHRLQTASQVR